MDATRAPVPRRGQPQAGAPRRRQVLVRLSDGDLVVVKAGAARQSLAVGAWMRELAVRAADDGAGWDLAVSRSEVIAQLVRVRVEVAVILAADDVTAVRDRVMAALLGLDTLIGTPPRTRHGGDHQGGARLAPGRADRLEVHDPRAPHDAESGEPGRAASVRLHRIPDAMHLLSLSRSVIYEQIRSGRLRSVRQGRARLIPADAIADYVALLVREAGADDDGAA